MALLLARNGWDTLLWGHRPAHMERMARERCNTSYLPEFPFPDNLEVQSDLLTIARAVNRYLVVVPSHAFRATLELLKRARGRHSASLGEVIIAWGTKGLEPGTAKLLSEVATEVFGAETGTGVISGPTFAREVARGLPTALTAAAKDLAIAEAIAEWLRNSNTRVYTSQDVAGVQLGGSIKNVIAIAAGISDGLGLGASARAALITRGLAELSRLGVALGGCPETFMGLAGVGDLILTCTDDQSRNRRVGIGLGEGHKLKDILAELGQEAEGVRTTRELYGLAVRLDVEMPITEQVYKVLYEGLAPVEAAAVLMQREPRQEVERI